MLVQSKYVLSEELNNVQTAIEVTRHHSLSNVANTLINIAELTHSVDNARRAITYTHAVHAFSPKSFNEIVHSLKQALYMSTDPDTDHYIKKVLHLLNHS